MHLKYSFFFARGGPLLKRCIHCALAAACPGLRQVGCHIGLSTGRQRTPQEGVQGSLRCTSVCSQRSGLPDMTWARTQSRAVSLHPPGGQPRRPRSRTPEGVRAWEWLWSGVVPSAPAPATPQDGARAAGVPQSWFAGKNVLRRLIVFHLDKVNCIFLKILQIKAESTAAGLNCPWGSPRPFEPTLRGRPANVPRF